MKKFLLFIALAIIVNIVSAQDATITIGTVQAPAEGQVVVPVTLTDISHPSGTELISGFALYFSYDANILAGKTEAVPTITMDSFWSTQGTVITNTIIDQPVPGMNTIAIIWATGGIVTAVPPQLIANITFNSTSGEAELLWASAKLKGEDGNVKATSYMVDYDGTEYLLTTISGAIYPSPNK